MLFGFLVVLVLLLVWLLLVWLLLLWLLLMLLLLVLLLQQTPPPPPSRARSVGDGAKRRRHPRTPTRILLLLATAKPPRSRRLLLLRRRAVHRTTRGRRRRRAERAHSWRLLVGCFGCACRGGGGAHPACFALALPARAVPRSRRRPMQRARELAIQGPARAGAALAEIGEGRYGRLRAACGEDVDEDVRGGEARAPIQERCAARGLPNPKKWLGLFVRVDGGRARDRFSLFLCSCVAGACGGRFCLSLPPPLLPIKQRWIHLAKTRRKIDARSSRDTRIL
jgi:hypothetical protein